MNADRYVRLIVEEHGHGDGVLMVTAVIERLQRFSDDMTDVS